MSRAQKPPAIGIDLGTTYCCVSVFREDEVHVIANDQGNVKTPNYVAFTDTEILVGDVAKGQATRNPNNTVFDVLRLVNNTVDPFYTKKYHLPFTIVENDSRLKIEVIYRGEPCLLSPETIVSLVIIKMKETAEAYIGSRVTEAVISVPANFNYSQRQAIKEAGCLAGLHVLKLINGPTAAALAYGLRHRPTGLKNVLIFDLGGGTADVSILLLSNSSTFQVLATAGDAHLGGEDFDNRIISHLAFEFKEKYNKSVTENKKALQRLRAACEQAKRILSSHETTRIEVDTLLDGIDFSTQITRAQFEELCNDLFMQIRVLFDRALHDANLKKVQIEEIVLVGGSTRIPFLQDMIGSIFCGKQLNKSMNPEEAIACGTALEAAIMSGHNSVILKDVSLMDAAPFSLGVMKKRGEMDTFLKRREPIPIQKSKEFTTFSDNLTSISIQVYEGESANVRDNKFISSFYISRIPPAQRGVPKIQVFFDIDANCSLKVKFVDPGTGKLVYIDIRNPKDRLKKQDFKKELEQIVRGADRCKEEDEKDQEKLSAKNQLESYVYSIKEKAESIVNTCNATLEWLESSSSLSEKEVYDSRLKSLKQSTFLMCGPYCQEQCDS